MVGEGGLPVLFLAGLATDAVSWALLQERLAPRHRLVLCDNRGVGRSPKPEGPYSLEQMAQDTVNLLDDLGAPRVQIVGHSMGGAIAQTIALRHPHRVERLALVCTASHFTGRPLTIARSWAGLLALNPSPQLLAQSLFPWLYSEALFVDPRGWQAAVKALEEHPYPLDASAVAAQVAALEGFDSRPELSNLQQPVLVVAAENDLLTPPSRSSELAQGLPQSRMEILAGTGHACMLEAPEPLAQVLESFLLP